MLKVKPDKLKIEDFRFFLIPGAIVFFVLVSGLLLIRPKIGEIFLIQKNLKKEEKKLGQLTAKTTALEGLDQTELSKRAEIIAKALPSEKNLPLLFFVLKKLATENNIKLRSLDVDPGELDVVFDEKKKEELSFLSFKVSVSGQSDDFKNFLAQIAKIAPLAKIEEIKIGSREREEELQADLLLDFAYLSLPETLGLAEEPLSQITKEEETFYYKLTQFDFSLVKKELPLVPVGKKNPFIF